jgi:hypothetical protein
MKPEDKKFFTALPDWKLMGLCIEREASGESRIGRIAVGTVILERVDRKGWMGKTIQEVILKPWQFSWTMPEAGEAYYNESVEIAKDFAEEYSTNIPLFECCVIARELLLNDIPRDKDLARAHCVQYLNPKTAAPTRAKWLKAGMVSIKVIEHHEFFRDKP